MTNFHSFLLMLLLMTALYSCDDNMEVPVEMEKSEEMEMEDEMEADPEPMLSTCPEDCIPFYITINSSDHFLIHFNGYRTYPSEDAFMNDHYRGIIENSSSSGFDAVLSGSSDEEWRFGFDNGRLSTMTVTAPHAGYGNKHFFYYNDAGSCGPSIHEEYMIEDDTTQILLARDTFAYQADCSYQSRLMTIESWTDTITYKFDDIIVNFEFDSLTNRWPVKSMKEATNYRNLKFPYPNNITKRIALVNGDTIIRESFLSEYKYYLDGSPEQEIRRYLNGKTDTLRFFYR